MIRNPFRRTLSCHEVMEVLQSYLDGEVEAATARRVARHLETCEGCEIEGRVYRRIKVSLASAAAPVDPTVLGSLRTFTARVARGEFD